MVSPQSCILLCASVFLLGLAGDAQNITSDSRQDKALSVFNVVKFPNSVCAATSGYNGTCYSSSECTTKGGTASGTCASSFGVCCVFSIACGATMDQNNSYAIISSFSTSSDTDPCIYTICKSSSDVCKIRIDFDTMVLASPFSLSSSAVLADGGKTGKCRTDTLQVINPGYQDTPIICGYNTGQHMFVPASAQCNKIHINIDTGTTTTTRKWQIKTTQYTCESEMAPVNQCLQYHTAATGSFANFAYDTSATTVAPSHTHLANQYYNVCIRRARSSCSVCYTPKIISAIAATGSSFGLGAASDATAAKSSNGATCTGITIAGSAKTVSIAGHGDYLEIANMQASPVTTATYANEYYRVCGGVFTAASTATITQGTICSFTVPFKVGVHMDDAENIGVAAEAASPNLNAYENTNPPASFLTGSGHGMTGFYLDYWQQSC